MRVRENEGGGHTVILTAGDNLNRVRKSHKKLVTPALREAFADPQEYFAQIAHRCPFQTMSRWLHELTKLPLWELHLHQGHPEEFTSAGFWWPHQQWVTIDLPNNPILDRYPQPLAKYYSLVGAIHWNDFPWSGGILGAFDHPSLANLGCNDVVDVNPDTTFIWGGDLCGKSLIYTTDGRGGWHCHEGGGIHLLGSIEDTIDWVCSELLAGREPEYDYGWLHA